MTINDQGRQSRAENSTLNETPTFTGNKALQIEEALSFEIGDTDRTGVDLVEPAGNVDRLGGLQRAGDIGLPGLTEPETMRHFVRLSQKTLRSIWARFPSAHAP